ncbi:MAG: hypothetical protein H3C47_08275 [Candidatus Cloacimonetes bacterium]|nr:hypothetical protein [Candidatus Cloacimonadota bacterium]
MRIVRLLLGIAGILRACYGADSEALTLKPVCVQHMMQANWIQMNKSRVVLPELEVQGSVSKALQTVGTVRTFKILNNVFSQGYVDKPFVLKYQAQSTTQFGQTAVNIWVGSDEFNSATINHLNSADGLFGLVNLQADRQLVVNEIGDRVRDLILPGAVSAFGDLQAINNSASDGINVLVYDIRDGFPGTGGSYVGGYFDPTDRSGGSGNDNLMNILHMDTFPNNPGGRSTVQYGLRKKDFYHVLAHEFQHVLHNQYDGSESIWINEGFSQFAIYRLLHQKQFVNGEKILNSPVDQPSQVPFWLTNPTSSLLMTRDEPQLTDQLGSRDDSAELRGLGYLFFNYLWQRLGGEISQNTAGADQLIRQIVQSPVKGVAGMETALAQVGLNFSQVFRDFVVALAADRDSGDITYRLDSFTENGTAVLSSLTDDKSVSLTYRPWEFRIFLLPSNVSGVVTASSAFHMAVVQGGQVIYSSLATSHQINSFSETVRIVISNPSWSTLTFTRTSGGINQSFATISELISGSFTGTSSGEAQTGSSSSSGGGGCFIATAAFQSKSHPMVSILCEFRDLILMNSAWGRDFVAFYYQNSPILAEQIRDSWFLSRLTMLFLLPLVGFAWLSIQMGIVASGFILLGFAVLLSWCARNLLNRLAFPKTA